MEYSEQTGRTEILVLLDLEKAFDKVSNESLHQALAIFNVDIKLGNLIEQMYTNPTFYVEKSDNQASTIYRQQ